MIRWRRPSDLDSWTRCPLEDADLAADEAIRVNRTLTAGGQAAAPRLADAGDEP